MAEAFPCLGISADSAQAPEIKTCWEMVQARFCELWDNDQLLDYALKSKDGTQIRVHKVFVAAVSQQIYSLITQDKNEKYQSSLTLEDTTAVELREIIDFIYRGNGTLASSTVEKLKLFKSVRRTRTKLDAAEEVMKMFYCIWKHGHFVDYVIKTSEGREISVHRCYMAAVSDFFHAMLTGTMMESRQATVELKGVDHTGLKGVLHEVYGGQGGLKLNTLEQFVSVADHLQVPYALQQCQLLLGRSIQSDTLADILVTSHDHNFEYLRDLCYDFIIEHIEDVISKSAHIQLTYEDIKSIVEHPKISLVDEFDQFLWIHKWIDGNKEERLTHVASLLAFVKFPLMTQENLAQVKEMAGYILSDVALNKLVTEAEEHISKPTHQRVLVDGEKFKDRNSPCLMLVEGEGRTFAGKHVHIMKAKQWWKLPDMDMRLAEAGTVTVVNDFLVFCGGQSDPSDNEPRLAVSNRCYIFDPRSYKWSQIACMNTRRMWFTLTVLNNEIYAVGGTKLRRLVHPIFQNANVIEKYSFETNMWTTVGKMTVKPRRHATCVSGDKLYLSGGYMELPPFRITNRMFCFNTVTRKFEEKADMLRQHFDHHLVVVNDVIYAVGPIFSINDSEYFEGPKHSELHNMLECYSIATDQWSSISLKHSLPEWDVLLSLGHHLYIIQKNMDHRHEQPELNEKGTIFNLKDRSHSHFDVLLTPEWYDVMHECFITFPAKILKQAQPIRKDDYPETDPLAFTPSVETMICPSIEKIS